MASGTVVLRRASQTVPEFGEHFLNLGVSVADDSLNPTLLAGEYVEEPSVFQVCLLIYAVCVESCKAEPLTSGLSLITLKKFNNLSLFCFYILLTVLLLFSNTLQAMTLRL